MALGCPEQALAAMDRAAELGCDEKVLRVIRAISQARAGAFGAAEAVLKPVFDSGEEPRVEVAEAIARVYLSKYQLPEANRALDRWIGPRPVILVPTSGGTRSRSGSVPSLPR